MRVATTTPGPTRIPTEKSRARKYRRLRAGKTSRKGRLFPSLLRDSRQESSLYYQRNGRTAPILPCVIRIAPARLFPVSRRSLRSAQRLAVGVARPRREALLRPLT